MRIKDKSPFTKEQRQQLIEKLNSDNRGQTSLIEIRSLLTSSDDPVVLAALDWVSEHQAVSLIADIHSMKSHSVPVIRVKVMEVLFDLYGSDAFDEIQAMQSDENDTVRTASLCFQYLINSDEMILQKIESYTNDDYDYHYLGQLVLRLMTSYKNLLDDSKLVSYFLRLKTKTDSNSDFYCDLEETLEEEGVEAE